jgi:DNA-binding transcriptional MerR regulator
MAGSELTIDELAQRLGMTTRNIREYQALGLLPPPRKRGRSGYYGLDHIARAGRIRELRSDGFPLELIRRVLDAEGQSGDERLVPFARALREPFQDEEPEVVDAEEFERRFGPADAATVAEAIALGLVRRRPGGRFELPSPRLARVGDAMADLGLGLADFIALTKKVRPLEEAVAELFVDVFRERVWEPFERAGAPDEELPRILEMLESLRPLALDTVLVQFKMAMDGLIERGVRNARKAS